ncbi:hypothetical protein [Escherichia coli]|uniref:hypothetical protein n=1 Tax=Escherichia coli TaxID=562 RepID=UPI000707D29F|nr:hypothetical protein [Escherichia coli]KQJ12601.1 hypothetical protein AM266_21380 [Escherichia coli]
MSEKIAVVYIGPKPVKKDTLTGSRTLFPRLEPVHVDSALAWQLLAFPDVWVRHEELDGVLKKQQQDEQLRQAQQAQEREQVALAEAENSFVVSVGGQDVEIRPGRVMHFACSPGEVSVLYAVAPKAGSRQVQDELRAWSEEVAAGALERLFMQTGVSWSDPSRAQYFSVLFSEGIRRAYRDTLATSPYSSYRNPVRRQRFY